MTMTRKALIVTGLLGLVIAGCAPRDHHSRTTTTLSDWGQLGADIGRLAADIDIAADQILAACAALWDGADLYALDIADQRTDAAWSPEPEPVKINREWLPSVIHLLVIREDLTEADYDALTDLLATGVCDTRPGEVHEPSPVPEIVEIGSVFPAEVVVADHYWNADRSRYVVEVEVGNAPVARDGRRHCRVDVTMDGRRTGDLGFGESITNPTVVIEVWAWSGAWVDHPFNGFDVDCTWMPPTWPTLDRDAWDRNAWRVWQDPEGTWWAESLTELAGPFTTETRAQDHVTAQAWVAARTDGEEGKE